MFCEPGTTRIMGWTGSGAFGEINAFIDGGSVSENEWILYMNMSADLAIMRWIVIMLYLLKVALVCDGSVPSW